MFPSQNCINLVKEFEGCRLEAYQDQRGIWTIGYGATGGNIGPGTTWTQAEAEQQLQQRLNGIASQVAAAVGSRVNQNQFDALCSLAYNIGPAAFRGSTLVRLINARDYDAAANAFLDWDHTNHQVNPGLLRRREAEKALFLS